MNIADRRLASETQLPRGNNFAEVNPSIIVDHQPFIRRAGGADPTFRAECETALRAYFRRLALIERLPNLIDHRATYSALVDDGVDVLTTQEREAAWEQFSDDATKEAAKGKLLGAILARLAADTETGARRVGQAVLDEFTRDLAALERFDGPLLAKYSAPRIEHPLAIALKRAIEKLRAMISAPHSLEWHYDPVMALSYSFPEDKPLVIRPEHQAAPAVVPPLAMPPVPALKTARGLAMSKAA